MMYRIQGQIIVSERSPSDGGRIRNSTIQVPTFFLDADIQGITNAYHALKIAEQVINPTASPNITIASLACEPVNSYGEATFVCPNEVCLHEAVAITEWMAEHGNPVCPVCDSDMELKET